MATFSKCKPEGREEEIDLIKIVGPREGIKSIMSGIGITPSSDVTAADDEEKLIDDAMAQINLAESQNTNKDSASTHQ